MINSIIIFGSGNVASHLVPALLESNIKILQIFSRNKDTACKLAKLANADFVSDIKSILPSADAYFFAMNDLANTQIANSLNIEHGKIMVHTAGSLSMNIFMEKTNNYGVFYPFQTFSRDSDLDFSKVPICLESSNDYCMNELEGLADRLSCNHYKINEDERKTIHLAGVFACNFMNHTVYLGQNILENSGIPQSILMPLLEQSFNKIINRGAKDSQTGPAIRNDKISIEKHLEILQKNKNLYDLYKVLSESINKTYNSNED